MTFEYTWRWYGPDDPISLSDIKQTGATGIVTALHHIPAGKAWEKEDIQQRKDIIEKAGLRWSVVESVPVHDDIKMGAGNHHKYINNYKQALHNLSACGIHTVCYNFMPVLDWTRTDLNFPQPDGSTALRFNWDALLAFDLFILQHKGAQQQYPEEQIKRAERYFKQLNEEEKHQLTRNIIAGLPGGHEGYSLEEFREMIGRFQSLDDQQVRENLRYFLQEITPETAEASVKLAIHPDDPPRKILGMPRVVSTERDLQYILDSADSPYNGLTFCAGSLGSHSDNNLAEMVKQFARRIHFFHFRSVQREKDGISFYEANHLEGDSDIARLMHIFMEQFDEQHDEAAPLRPDHGHRMLDDFHKETNPGYSCIGRMRGLAEIRGIEAGLQLEKSE